MLEAIQLCEERAGRKLNSTYVDQNRSGDHIWYVSDVGKFRRHYPDWSYTYSLDAIVDEIYAGWDQRLSHRRAA
jgi:CDP-paratose 2-epimerase